MTELLLSAGVLAGPLAAQPSAPVTPPPGSAIIVTLAPPLRHGVAVLSRGTTNWTAAQVNQVLRSGDLLRTDDRSTAVLRLGERDTIPVDTNSLLRIEGGPAQRKGVELLRGILDFFHRGAVDETDVHSPFSSALIRGTEFHMQVADDGTTTLTLFDGEVEMTNSQGRITLHGGEAARVEPGKAPARTAFIEAATLMQWRLYYPAVLHLDELKLSATETALLESSLAAYRSGDLLAALALYPAGRQPASEAERIYLAALLLSLGRVEQAEGLLSLLETVNAAPQLPSQAEALRTLIDAVKTQPASPSRVAAGTVVSLPIDSSATTALAESYRQQSLLRLEAARAAARQATQLAPGFSFGWSRLAELEFSFGRIGEAEKAVDRSLELAPRNAQANALKGFLLATRNRTDMAIASFNRAIAIDGSLGNGWLGRGLCQIRQGHSAAGLQDLQMAATVEPQRAVLRSYLGKAWSHAGDASRAAHELVLALQLDPHDPRAWFYQSLLEQQRYRAGDAVDSLERAQALQSHETIERSRLLGEQDRAVRGANLAGIYRDAGLLEESVREAIHAVNADYASPAGHLFLANSYAQLNELTVNNLRYETPQANEYLVATLLAPVGAGPLSQAVSQQEYGRLFEQDHVGVASATEYLSRGSWRQYGAQFGRLGNFSYSLDGFYLWDPGQQHNNDIELTTLSARAKVQLTPSDSVDLQIIDTRSESGDLAQHFRPAETNPGLRQRETQQPLAIAGYHHEWNPGVHTLVLGARLEDELRVTDPFQDGVMFQTNLNGLVNQVIPLGAPSPLRYQSELEIYSAELQQIVQQRQHTFIAGARYQTGAFRTRSMTDITNFVTAAGDVFLPAFFDNPPQSAHSDFHRLTTYGYWHWQPLEPLRLVAGLTYDQLRFPVNHRFAPISDQESSTEKTSPKGGVIWTPVPGTTVRSGYSRALGGVSFDQSFQLEPSQVAGFNQAWRSLIPESVAGANTAATFENWGLALDQKLAHGTYVGVTAEWLKSEVQRERGAFEIHPELVPPATGFILQSDLHERLSFAEQSLTVSLSRLLGEQWSVGTRYRVSRAEYSTRLSGLAPGFASSNPFPVSQDLEALLHHLNLFAVFNHPSGFFSHVEALWMVQDNRADSATLGDENLWQYNAWAGWRFARRRVEVRLGVLNLSNQDYHLNPLNLTASLPRQRTFVASVKFCF